MDKALIRSRFAKASDSYLRHALVQRRIAWRMVKLIQEYVPRSAHRRVLEIGCGTGLFTRAYLHRWQPERLLLNDLCPEVASFFADLPEDKVRFVAKDAETLDFPSGQDLVVSCSALQWFDAPERFLLGCRRLLSPGGYLVFSTFGPKNAEEMRALTGDVLPYRSLGKLTDALSGSYRLVHASESCMRLSFPSPLDVLRHLKDTGVTGIRPCHWTPRKLADFSSRYAGRYADSKGNVTLTYHPIYMILIRS